MKRIAALLVVALVWMAYRHFNAPITYPAGVLIASDPQQVELPTNAGPIQHGAFQLKPLARFSLDARLLHRKRYRWDRQSALVPFDFAVGWQRMSDQAVLDRLTISQSMRFYFYEYRMPSPIPPDEIVRASTNLHLIPINAAVAKACRSMREGELIHLEGQLVEATGSEIGTWRSSLRRDDSGNGACELVLVEELSKLNPSEPRPPAILVRR